MQVLQEVLSPTVEINYGQLSPDVHRATERIIERRDESAFMVPGVGLEDLDTIRNVLQSAEGGQLPLHYFDEHGDYVPIGRTPVVEERHTRVALIDGMNDSENGEKGLWLRVPWHEQATATEVETRHRLLSDSKFLLALGSTGLVTDALFIKGLETGKLGYFGAFAAGIGGMIVAGVQRLRQSHSS